MKLYSDEEFNQAQEQLLSEGYTWFDSVRRKIITDYPIVIIVSYKYLTWCKIEFANTYLKKEWRKLKLDKLNLIYKENKKQNGNDSN